MLFRRAERYDHYSMGNLRGLKRDVWEGGHHVPFIVKWPGKIKAGTISNEVISQVDIMATLAHITKTDLPEKAAPDSYDITPVLMQETYNTPLREATVHNTSKHMYGLRKGEWVYINKPTGQVSIMPEYFQKLKGYDKVNYDTEGILFNLKKRS